MYFPDSLWIRETIIVDVNFWVDRMFPWNYCRGRNSSGTFCSNFLKLNGLQFHLITSLPISHKLCGWKLGKIVFKPKHARNISRKYVPWNIRCKAGMETWHLMSGVAQLMFCFIQSFLLTQTIIVQLRILLTIFYPCFICLNLMIFFWQKDLFREFSKSF